MRDEGLVCGWPRGNAIRDAEKDPFHIKYLYEEVIRTIHYT